MKYFPPFRFDQQERKLWRGATTIPLTRKAADLLACLVHHAGTTVPHQTLMDSVWPGTHVQPDNVKVLVHEVRQALDDDPASPRFVRSEAGRGYAFVTAVADAPCPLSEGLGHERPVSIAREPAIALIRETIERAVADSMVTYVLVEGVAGSGKTTLCRDVIRRAARPELHTVCGRARRGTSNEPFAPVVDALDRIAERYPARARPIFSRKLPSWLQWLASFRSQSEPRSQESVGRLARELAAALEELCRDVPFVIVFEDLHWAGHETFDLLDALAADAVPSRLTIIGTYVPFGAGPNRQSLDHLVRVLRLRGHPAPIRTGPFTWDQTKEYLDARLGRPSPDAVVDQVHRATLGHAASLSTVSDELIASGALSTMPRVSLEPLIQQVMGDVIRDQIDELHEGDRTLLEAAAAAGWRFTDRAVADGLGERHAMRVQRDLDMLATHLPMIERMPVSRGRGPMPTVSFRFTHQQWFEMLRGDLGGRAPDDEPQEGSSSSSKISKLA